MSKRIFNKEKVIRILFPVIGIIMIFVTFTIITPVLEEATPNSVEQYYIGGNAKEIVRKTLGIDIPKSVEILEFEQDYDIWYHYSIKCEMFEGASEQFKNNISEAYAIGKKQPNFIYDVTIDSVSDLLGILGARGLFDINDAELERYYHRHGFKENIRLVCKCMPEISVFITKENGKEYIYINT